MEDETVCVPDKALAGEPPRDAVGCVLLVDDDRAFLGVLKRMIERLGYEALSTANGLDAIAIYRERAREIGAVLLDLDLPGMDGWTTLDQLHRIDSTTRVILISGRDEHEVRAEMPRDARLRCLQKPFSMNDIGQLLRDAMCA